MMFTMSTNRNGFTTLDAYVAAEVRADIARNPRISVKSIAEDLQLRRATLTERTRGRRPFSPSLLSAVASLLATTASETVARPETHAPPDADRPPAPPPRRAA